MEENLLPATRPVFSRPDPLSFSVFTALFAEADETGNLVSRQFFFPFLRAVL